MSRKGEMERQFDEWERTQSPRAKRTAAIRELDVALGRAVLAVPPVRWVMRRFGLVPKAKYREDA